MRIGLIGLGKLGRAVGERLLDCELALTAWNRSPQADEVLGRLAAHRVETLDAVVRASDALIVLVRDDAAVDEVVGHLCATPIAGKLVLQMSTVRPNTALAAGVRIGDAGGQFLDVPVAGTLGPAREGKLLMLAGGDPSHVARAADVFTALGRRTFHLGPIGAGSTMKLVLNLILTVYNETLAEALTLGHAGGLTIETMLDVLTESPAALPMVAAKRPLFEGTGTAVTVDLARVRDELMATEQTARALGLLLPAAAATVGMLTAAADAGYGSRDVAALTRYWLEQVGAHPNGPKSDRVRGS